MARYPRSYEPGSWLPPLPLPAEIATPAIVAPELADYAALCA